MTMSTMTQCRLERDGAFDTRWIETRFAKIGSKVHVKKTNEIWTVIERYTTWPTERVLAHEHDHITMPTVTDAFPDGHGGRRLPKRQ